MAELPERTVKRTYKAVPDIPPKGGDDPFMATLAVRNFIYLDNPHGNDYINFLKSMLL